jgi:hypothetical protein
MTAAATLYRRSSECQSDADAKKHNAGKRDSQADWFPARKLLAILLLETRLGLERISIER